MTSLSAMPAADLVKIIAEYGPAIEALIQFIELHKDNEKRALSMNSLTRGLHYAKETGDTTQLSQALRSHLAATGTTLYP